MRVLKRLRSKRVWIELYMRMQEDDVSVLLCFCLFQTPFFV